VLVTSTPIDAFRADASPTVSVHAPALCGITVKVIPSSEPAETIPEQPVTPNPPL
jgi:hypothetical protein